MSQKDNGPDIDTLLKNSNWEDRVAAARAKRETVLAAKRAEAEAQEAKAAKAAQTIDMSNAPAARRRPAEYTPPRARTAPAPPPPKPYRTVLIVLGKIAVLLIAGIVGAGLFWAFQDQISSLLETWWPR